jgi:hypothetical protein
MALPHRDGLRAKTSNSSDRAKVKQVNFRRQVGHEIDAFNKKMRCETCVGTGTVTLRRREPAHDGPIPSYQIGDYHMRLRGIAL